MLPLLNKVFDNFASHHLIVEWGRHAEHEWCQLEKRVLKVVFHGFKNKQTLFKISHLLNSFHYFRDSLTATALRLSLLNCFHSLKGCLTATV